MDVWEYFQQRDRELADQSAAWEHESPYTAEEGSDGQRGRIFGRVVLSDSAFLQVHEAVQVVDGRAITRLTYAYFLIYDGAEIWGYERDPLHDDMPVHRHDRDHHRHPTEPISFKDALTEAWKTVAAEEDLRADAE